MFERLEEIRPINTFLQSNDMGTSEGSKKQMFFNCLHLTFTV